MRAVQILAITMVAVVLPALLSVAPAHAQANLIASFFVDNFHFSPNGDNVKDETTISYNLVDSALVHLLVLEKDSTTCLLYTSPSPRDLSTSRMPSSA